MGSLFFVLGFRGFVEFFFVRLDAEEGLGCLFRLDDFLFVRFLLIHQ